MLRLMMVAVFLFQLQACAPGTALKSGPAVLAVEQGAVAPAARELVSGKVKVLSGQPLEADIRIQVWPLSALSLDEPPLYVTVAAGDAGLFSLQLPQGSYYFVAEGEDLYAYYGRNPVVVPEGGIRDLNITLVERRPAAGNPPRDLSTGVYGQLTVAGRPLAGAVVSVYVDLNSQLKGLGLGMTAPTDASGRFQMELPAGTYYLVARKRNSGSMMGPLAAGDFIGHFSGNPVRVKEGQVADVSIAMIEVPENISRISDEIFGSSSISGQVLDGQGKPLAGIRVLLYDNSMMLNRPLFVSQPTDSEGRYVVSFPQGGTYWLAARNQLGGPPTPGQLYGRYLGSPDGSVQLKTGEELAGIELVVEKMK